uniref:Uncharacterized protein n=1 Tax=Rhizophora mucronata TaxID=61149 RepID=A0A2P2PUP9_RHIMU
MSLHLKREKKKLHIYRVQYLIQS